MYNNDMLIRIRYAFDIKNTDMVTIFKLGGYEITKEDVLKMLTKPLDCQEDDIDTFEDVEENEGHIACDNHTLEMFFNGLIIFKRGQKETKDGQPQKPILIAKNKGTMNNVMMKKMKIALALNSDEVQQILEDAGVIISKGELSALYRKEGERKYMECGDKYARKFLKGLTMRYRKN